MEFDPNLISGNGDLNGFPVLLTLEGPQGGILEKAKSDGSDFVVTRGDGVTPLPCEIVRWDPGTPSAEIWFRADVLSDISNRFYVYYGNPDTVTAPMDGEVWGAEHLAVYHFAEDPGLGVLWDYSPFGHHGLSGSGSAWTSQNAITGPVGQAWRFNGSTNWIDGDSIGSSDSTFTISGWFGCWDQVNNSADFALSVSNNNSNWHLSAKRNESQLSPDFAHARGYYRFWPNLPDTLPHLYTWVMDGVQDTVRFYYDGVEQGYRIRYVAPAAKPPDKVYLGVNISGNVGIGSNLFGNSQDLMQGIVDEFRVREGTRSPGWVLTEYNNQRNPSVFAIFGAEETRLTGVGDPEPRAGLLLPRVFPNPFHRSSMIEFELVGQEQVKLEVYSVDGRLVRELFTGVVGPGAIRIPWDGRGDRGDWLKDGVYFLRVETRERSWSGRVVLLR